MRPIARRDRSSPGGRANNHHRPRRRRGHAGADPLLSRAYRAASSSPRRTASAANPAAPLVPVPDLHGLRTKVVALAFLLSDRIREGADIGVDALTWKIARPHDPVAFTIGPGPLALSRTPSASELRFSTDPHVASTPLAVRALLPRRGTPRSPSRAARFRSRCSECRRERPGCSTWRTRRPRAGPVSSSPTTAARVTFDGEGGTRGLSLSNPRLALDVVRGLDLQVQARGAATAEGDLRLDDLAATFGAVHIAAGGVLEQRPDHVAAALHFDVPTASCQSLLDSLPGALLPALQGTRFAGNLRRARPFRLRHAIARRPPARLRRQGPVPGHASSRRARARALRAALLPSHLSSRRLHRRGDDRPRHATTGRRSTRSARTCRSPCSRPKTAASPSTTASIARRSGRRSSRT